MNGHPLQAALLDLAMRPLLRQRRRVVADARGRVVEVGFGTGLNLPWYPQVTELVAVEPDPAMRRRAAARVAEAPFRVTLHDARAEHLPVDDGWADTVIITWVLCTVDDPVAALAEARRVLRPGGALRLAEHVRSESPAIAALQDLVNPAWRCLAAGCNLNRDILAALRSAGFHSVELRPPRDVRCSPAPSWRAVAIR